MSYYEGLSCPVCNEPFTDEADVVVCPQCGLPHHRSCWATENRCHEADKHGTPEQWSRNKTETENQPTEENISDEKNICPNCSAENARYAEFCTRCGKELDAEDWHSAEEEPSDHQPTPNYAPFSSAEQYSDQEIINETSAKDLAAIVGSNTLYYIPRFRKTNKKKICGWNWASFLLGSVWMLYRKQYVSGIITFLIEFACSFFYSLFDVTFYVQTGKTTDSATLKEMMANQWFIYAIVAISTLLLLRIILGCFGNNFYLSSCKKKIKKARLAIPDISSAELSTKGGVSFGMAAIFYFLPQLLIRTILIFFL